MELKTNVVAEFGRQDILITREFDLPVELLFLAFSEPQIIEQWMGTKVVEFDFKKHGNYHFSTSNSKGQRHEFHGTIHNIILNEKIIRTFEMVNMAFGVQLEFYDFEYITESTSKLRQHVIYQTVNHRDENLKLPFKQGINWAHSRLEETLNKYKK